MKTPANARSGSGTTNTATERAVVLRFGAAKTFEHRYTRRKIREQLRRLGGFNAEDEMFA